MSQRRRAAAAATLLALALLVPVGCQGTPTFGGVSCAAALAEGVLEADGDELLLGGERVVWPDGVRVARANDGLVLVGFFGQVIAREGDQISMGGGFQGDGLFHGCGDIRVS